MGEVVTPGAYRILAGFYDRLMEDQVDYDTWCEYVLQLAGLDLAGLNSGKQRDRVSGHEAKGGSRTDWDKISRSHTAKTGDFPHKVLDLACGTGEFTYRFAQRGLDVTAVDISAEMLAVAENKARTRGLKVRFLQQDMRHLQLPGAFDTIFCLCDSLNYLVEVEDLRACLAGVSRLLAPGGRFVFDLNTEYKLATVYGNNTYAEDRGEFAYIWENSYDPRQKTCEMYLSFFIQKLENKAGGAAAPCLYEKVIESHVQRAFEPDLIAKLCQASGLEVIGQYGDLRLSPPVPATERVTYVCRKTPGMPAGKSG